MKKAGLLFKKIFVLVSIVFILGLICLYSYRLIHFYLLENGNIEIGNNKKYFVDKLKSTINVSDLNGGLYIINDEYIYKFNATKNYLWYSGQLWRILKVNSDKTIDIVMDDSLTILNSKYLNNYYIENYLTDFYNKLDKDLLVEISYCNDKFDVIDNLKCDNTNFANISLLDVKTYQVAGGSSSFLNNNNSFWITNTDTKGNNWYINSDGALSIGSDNNSFGVRPVIRLKSEIDFVEGNGTKDNPYIVKKKGNNELIIGEYIKFNDNLWRIIDINNKGIIISSDNCLKENNQCILMPFGNTNIFEKSSLYSYLNETYYNSIKDKEFIIKGSFGTGNYLNNNYNNVNSKYIDSFVGISKVSDYYISKKTNSYLLTTNDLEAVFSINEKSNYYPDFPEKEKRVYPVLNLDNTLNVIAGEGTKNNPYALGR